MRSLNAKVFYLNYVWSCFKKITRAAAAVAAAAAEAAAEAAVTTTTLPCSY